MKKIWLVLWVIFCLVASNSLAKGLPIGEHFGRSIRVVASDSVEPQQRVHRRGNINFCVSNWGTLGSQNRLLCESQGCLFCDHPDSELHAPSFEFPSNSGLEYLYQGALWIGGVVEGETLVSVGADGWFWIYEFYPSSKIEETGQTRGGGLHDQECMSVFTDTAVPPPHTQWQETMDWDRREHKPLNVEIIQRSYSWASPSYEDFVILDYTIKNIGNKPVSDVYLGFLLDPDIYQILLGPY